MLSIVYLRNKDTWCPIFKSPKKFILYGTLKNCAGGQSMNASNSVTIVLIDRDYLNINTPHCVIFKFKRNSSHRRTKVQEGPTVWLNIGKTTTIQQKSFNECAKCFHWFCSQIRPAKNLEYIQNNKKHPYRL